MLTGGGGGGGGRIDCELLFALCSARCDVVLLVWYIERGRSRVGIVPSAATPATGFVDSDDRLEVLVGEGGSSLSVH